MLFSAMTSVFPVSTMFNDASEFALVGSGDLEHSLKRFGFAYIEYVYSSLINAGIMKLGYATELARVQGSQ